MLVPLPGTEPMHPALEAWSLNHSTTREVPFHSFLQRNMISLRSRSVQFSSVAQSCLILCDPMDCSMPGFPVPHQIMELAQTISIESVIPSNHLILCSPLLLLPSIFPSIKVFSHEDRSSHQVAKVLEFQLPMNVQD